MSAAANPLLAWWDQADSEQRQALADAVGSTTESLRVLAHGYRTGGVASLSPELARAINLALDGALRREDLCPACGGCEFAAHYRNSTTKR